MKKTILLTLLSILISGQSIFSQTYVFQVQEKGSNKWGYATFDGNVIVEPKYKYTHEFTKEGYAMVAYKNKFLLINMKGEIIETEMDKFTPNRHDMPYITKYTSRPPYVGWNSFSDSYLVVKEYGKFGCISPDGKITISIKYDQLTDFNGGYALAELNKKFFVLDKNGLEIPVSLSNIKEIKPFSEGLGIVEVKGEKWGFVDSSGTVVIEPQFSRTGYFNAGLAWARNEEGKIGFINKKGEWAIEPQFRVAKPFDPESGMAMVKPDEGWGYVDTKGKLHFFEETEKTYIFTNGLALGRKNGKVGFLNNLGEWAIEPQFDNAFGFKNGYAAVEFNGLFGIIDKEGKWIVIPVYKGIGDVTVVK